MHKLQGKASLFVSQLVFLKGRTTCVLTCRVSYMTAPLLSTSTQKEGFIHLLSLEMGQPAYLPVWVASCLPL